MATTKKRGRPAKATVQAPTDDAFVISVNTGEKVIVGTGDTLLAALKALTPPDKIVKKTIVTISSGEKRKEILYTVQQAKRFFYPVTQYLTAKHFALLLK